MGTFVCDQMSLLASNIGPMLAQYCAQLLGQYWAIAPMLAAPHNDYNYNPFWTTARYGKAFF